MQRPLQPLDEAPDVIELDGRAEVERRHLVWGGGSRFARLEPGPQRVVDDGPERAPRYPGCTLKTRGHVVVEGQGRSHRHIMKSGLEAS